MQAGLQKIIIIGQSEGGKLCRREVVKWIWQLGIFKPICAFPKVMVLRTHIQNPRHLLFLVRLKRKGEHLMNSQNSDKEFFRPSINGIVLFALPPVVPFRWYISNPFLVWKWTFSFFPHVVDVPECETPLNKEKSCFIRVTCWTRCPWDIIFLSCGQL